MQVYQILTFSLEIMTLKRILDLGIFVIKEN
jgi:hypothetical protein